MRTETAPKTIFLKDYTPPPYLVEKLSMLFQIHNGATTVTSTALYKRNGDGAAPLVLDGEHMELLSVLIDGQPALYDKTDDTLIIQNPPAQFTLTITTKFNPAENTALEGLYKSGDTYCTQCEAQGFRRITYFQDRPDVMTVFSVRIEADKTTLPVLLSNGNLIAEGNISGDRHFTEWHDPFPKPCYLFALVADRKSVV